MYLEGHNIPVRYLYKKVWETGSIFLLMRGKSEMAFVHLWISFFSGGVFCSDLISVGGLSIGSERIVLEGS